MSKPTVGEAAFARRVGLDAQDVADARDVLNGIAALPWPEPARLALLVRLAQMVDADVGDVLGKLALDIAPLSSFERLLPIIGLADKRVAGLARALSKVDPEAFTSTTQLLAAEQRVKALETENATLRTELNSLRARSLNVPSESNANVMALNETAASISSQLAEVDDALRSRRGRLQLGPTQVHLRVAATAVDKDLAFDFSRSQPASSALTLDFVPRESPPTAPSSNPRVPDVRGYSPTLARRKLEAQGLAVAIASSAAISKGTVAEQSPAPETSVAAATVVRLIVR